MKKIFLGACALFAILAAGCSKNDSGTTPNNSGNGTNISLNATEQKMIGTWFLKRERYTLKANGAANASTDSNYTNFPNKPYLTFTSTKHPAAGSAFNAAGKIMTDNALMSQSSALFVSIQGSVRGTNSSESSWYYNETSTSLILGQATYPYIKVNGNELLVTSTFVSSGTVAADTLWFQK